MITFFVMALRATSMAASMCSSIIRIIKLAAETYNLITSNTASVLNVVWKKKIDSHG